MGAGGDLAGARTAADAPVRVEGEPAAEGGGGGGGVEAVLGRVAVALRTRPPKGAARGELPSRLCARFSAEDRQVTLLENKGGHGPFSGGAHRREEKVLSYDAVLGHDASQLEVYEALGRPVLEDVIQGYHGCVLAYGQTGAGKTHSLLNMAEKSADDAGLLPRIVADLFVGLSADWRGIYTVKVGMFQIYNEQVDDLLKPGKTNLRVKQSVHGGWEVEGLSWYTCRTPEYLMQVVRNGRKRLIYAETHMNKHSSRSHAVVQIRLIRNDRAALHSLESSTGDLEGAKREGRIQVSQRLGQLTVVDLAGSERVKKSHSEGMRLTEAKNINTSLLAFGNCVQALASRKPYVPYRESTLTKVLETSLSGNCRTALLVCVSPEEAHASETMSSLEFVSRAMRIETDPQIQEATVDVDAGDLAKQLASGFKSEALKEIEEENWKFEKAAIEAESIAQAAAARAAAAESKAAEQELASKEKERSLEQQLKEMKDKLVVAQAKVVSLQQRERAKDKKAKELEAKLASSEAALEAVKAEAAMEEEAAKMVIDALRLDSEKAKAAAHEERAKLLAASRKNEEVVGQLVAATTKLSELEESRTRLEGVLQSNTEQLEQVRQELENQRGRASNLESSEKGLAAETQRLLERQAQLLAARARIEDELASTKQSLSRVKEEFKAGKAGWDSEKEILHGLLGDLQAKMEEMKEEMRSSSLAAQTRYERLQAEATEGARAAREAAREEAAAAAARLRRDFAVRLDDQISANAILTDTLDITKVTAGEEAARLAEGLEEAKANYASMQLSWLLAGLHCTKQGRNGKDYKRLIRLSEDGQSLEWLPVGDAVHRMGLKKASVRTEGEVVTIRGADRDLRVRGKEMDAKLWLQALKDHLSVG